MIYENWEPIESAPEDGSYLLLLFDGTFTDSECLGVAVGKRTQAGWWLTAIWAGSTAHRDPIGWQNLLEITRLNASSQVTM